MYESFFQLHGSPFPATPTVANYFPCQAIEAARQSLVRSIERAEGPGFVVGPAGVGKSLLLRVLAEHFREMYKVVLLSETRVLTRKSLLQFILFEMGLTYRGLDEGELRLALIDSLRPSDACPHGILLLIDEAHTLPVRLLDEIRMITNVVRDGSPRARLVLGGGPRLEERFANPKVESFSQRIAARCYLQSLSREETHEYVRAQLSWVGGNPDAIFTEDAIRAVYQASDGIPRLINQVCDHALVLAQAHGIRLLTAASIQEAWANLQQLPPPWQASTTQQREGTTVIEFGEMEEVVVTDSVDTLSPAISFGPPETPRATTDELSTIIWEEQSPQNVIWEERAPQNVIWEERVPQNVVWEERAPQNVIWEERAPPSVIWQEQSRLIESPLGPAPQAPEPSPFIWRDPTSVMVGFPPAALEVEWFDGEESTPATPEVASAPDPFQSSFDEEVVVIDHSEASEIEAFRGRPRVSCREGREMLAELLARCKEGASFGAKGAYSFSASETSAAAPPTNLSTAFEFTTLQSIDDIPAFAQTPRREMPQAGWDESHHDLDEEIECVPLSFSRGSASDDRDVIIIEDDLPAVNVFPDNDAGERPRRMEYRELFAQLRRSSP